MRCLKSKSDTNGGVRWTKHTTTLLVETDATRNARRCERDSVAKEGIKGKYPVQLTERRNTPVLTLAELYS